MPKKAEPKFYYGDIEVVERTRLRIDLELTGKPTKAKVLAALQGKAGSVNDIMDTENLGYEKVISVKGLEVCE